MHKHLILLAKPHALSALHIARFGISPLRFGSFAFCSCSIDHCHCRSRIPLLIGSLRIALHHGQGSVAGDRHDVMRWATSVGESRCGGMPEPMVVQVTETGAVECRSKFLAESLLALSERSSSFVDHVQQGIIRDSIQMRLEAAMHWISAGPWTIGNVPSETDVHHSSCYRSYRPHWLPPVRMSRPALLGATPHQERRRLVRGRREGAEV